MWIEEIHQNEGSTSFFFQTDMNRALTLTEASGNLDILDPETKGLNILEKVKTTI